MKSSLSSRPKSPPRNHPGIEILNLSDKRKVWVVGDIHGCFKLLSSRLKAVGFKADQDALVSCGDLVNRGPHNHLVSKWLPKMKRVVGNHEELLARAFASKGQGEDFWLHYQQGGRWFWEDVTPDEQKKLAKKLWKAPVALEIITPGHNRIGVVHARVPGNNWDSMKEALNDPDHPEFEDTQLNAIWCREQIDELRRYGKTEGVSGIERVFFGHTPVPELTSHKNCVWIDTKAYRTEQLAIVDVDRWIELNPIEA